MEPQKAAQRHRLGNVIGMAVAALVLVLGYWFFGCPIKYFSGLSCPGCGMTRAAMALARLDVAGAMQCHPLIWLVPPLGWLAFSKTAAKRPKLRVAGLAVIVAAFGAVYLVRFATGSTVVNWSVPGIVQDLSSGFARFCFWEN